MNINRPLRVFLCHSSADKPAVRELYQKLRAEAWIQPWLDEEELFPGMDWNMEIEKAIEATDVILVCLSNKSITKEGYVQKEITRALDFAEYKPEGALFIIPVRLEECTPPKRLARWQYADYFEGQRERGLKRLIVSLKNHANTLEITDSTPITKVGIEETKVIEIPKAYSKNKLIEWLKDDNKILLPNGIELVKIPAGEFLMGSENENLLAADDEKPQFVFDIPYDFWVARFAITNEQFDLFAKSHNIAYIQDDWDVIKDHPVVNVTCKEAERYCNWLRKIYKKHIPFGLVIRLPFEFEWEKAARGESGSEWPWGNYFDESKCNVFGNGGKGGTTPVHFYSPEGDSPYGCADMVGNVWEWTRSIKKKYPFQIKDFQYYSSKSVKRVVRGGSFALKEFARCASRGEYNPLKNGNNIGFRICIAPPVNKSSLNNRIFPFLVK